jgi:hypothetical protein
VADRPPRRRAYASGAITARFFRSRGHLSHLQDGATPLHSAASELRPLLTQLLLDGGADPRRVDSDGFTPLQAAVMSLGWSIGENQPETAVRAGLSCMRMLVDATLSAQGAGTAGPSADVVSGHSGTGSGHGGSGSRVGSAGSARSSLPLLRGLERTLVHLAAESMSEGAAARRRAQRAAAQVAMLLPASAGGKGAASGVSPPVPATGDSSGSGDVPVHNGVHEEVATALFHLLLTAEGSGCARQMATALDTVSCRPCQWSA